MPNEIKTIHINYAHDCIMAISDASADQLDQYLLLGAYCIKHDIKPTDLARATYDRYEFSEAFGTVKNNVASATAIVKRFGSVALATKAIDAYNAENRACFNPQTLAKKFGLQADNNNGSSTPVDCIDQLVLDGHLPAKHAKFLKANGYIIVKK